MDRNNQNNLSDDQKNNNQDPEIAQDLGDILGENLDSKADTVVLELTQRLTLAEESWKRALADYQNLKNRHEREMSEILKFAGAEYLKKLLPVYDSLDMLAKFNSDQGLVLTVSQFRQILKEIGLEEIEVLGKNFDPQTMEAVEMVSGEKDKVVEVIQKGFNFKGKILRVALVKVGDGSAIKE